MIHPRMLVRRFTVLVERKMRELGRRLSSREIGALENDFMQWDEPDPPRKPRVRRGFREITAFGKSEPEIFVVQCERCQLVVSTDLQRAHRAHCEGTE